MSSLTDQTATRIAVEEGSALVLRDLVVNALEFNEKSYPMTFTAVPAGRMEMELRVILTDQASGDHATSRLVPYTMDEPGDVGMRFTQWCREAYVEMLRALREESTVTRYLRDGEAREAWTKS